MNIRMEKFRRVLLLCCWWTVALSAAATTRTATEIGMVPDDESKSAHNTHALREALLRGVDGLSINGAFHVEASSGIPVGRPLRLTGGQLIIHRSEKGANRLFKVMEGLSVHADNVTFTGVVAPSADYSLHFCVFSNTRSHHEGDRLTGDLGTLSFSHCRIKDIALLRVTQKVTDGDGSYADVGVDSILIRDCDFDARTFCVISFDGGLIRKACDVAGNHVRNLCGVFFNHNTTHTGDWKQNTHNAPILFHGNHVTTAQPACNYYVCALLATSRSAHVYDNVFDNFLGVCYTRGDHKLMEQRSDLKDILVREAACNNASDDVNGVYGAALYEVYLSCEEVYFHHNVINNMLAYRLSGTRTTDNNPRVSTCYSKNCAHVGGHARKRHIHDNQWVWDEAYCRKVLSHAWETQYLRLARAKGEKPIDKETWIRQQYFTRMFNYVTSFDEVVFKNNVIDITGGSITAIPTKNTPNAYGRFEFSGNTLHANQITGALCRFLPPVNKRSLSDRQLDEMRYEGKTLRQWMRDTDQAQKAGKSCHVHTIDKEGSAGFVMRVVAPGGEVIKSHTTPRDKTKKDKTIKMNHYFINDDITLVTTQKDEGESVTYHLEEQKHPDVLFCNNKIHLDGSRMPVILFRGVCNYPFQGEGGYQAHKRWTYGHITVKDNAINGADYVVDPGRALSLTERGNTCRTTKVPSKGKTTTLDIRNFTKQTDALTLLPANNETGYHTRIYLDGLQGTHTYRTAFDYSPTRPLTFMMYHDGNGSYHLTVSYSVKGKKKSRELTFTKQGTKTIVTGMKNGQRKSHTITASERQRQTLVDDDLTISIEPYNTTTAMTVIRLHNKASGKQFDGPVTLRWDSTGKSHR